MRNLEKVLFKFSNNMLQPHDNANGATIAPDVDDDGYFVSCRIDGLEKNRERTLFIVCENLTLAAFIKKFGLSSLDDVEHIDREKMLRLYNTGDAYYWCMVNGGFKSLTFTKFKDKLYVKEYNNEDTHILSTLLSTPEDFLDYTEYYFRNRKDQ